MNQTIIFLDVYHYSPYSTNDFIHLFLIISGIHMHASLDASSFQINHVIKYS